MNNEIINELIEKLNDSPEQLVKRLSKTLRACYPDQHFYSDVEFIDFLISIIEESSKEVTKYGKDITSMIEHDLHGKLPLGHHVFMLGDTYTIITPSYTTKFTNEFLDTCLINNKMRDLARLQLQNAAQTLILSHGEKPIVIDKLPDSVFIANWNTYREIKRGFNCMDAWP